MDDPRDITEDIWPDPVEHDEGATLFINRTDSECGNCQRGADPYEESHVTALGYFPIDLPDDSPRRKGCGAKFTKVGSRYMGDGIRQAAREMRPDLPWTEDLL